MDLVGLLIAVVILGLVAWCIQGLPMSEPFKRIAIVLLVIITLIYFADVLHFHRLWVR